MPYSADEARPTPPPEDHVPTTAAPPGMSIEELWLLPEDGQRHELLNGDHVVTPSPISLHQKCLRLLDHALTPSIEAHGNVELYFSPADVILSPNTLVQPDIFLVHSPRATRPRIWDKYPIPILAIEVLSPSTARRHRGAKRKLYLEAGTEEYWIVDCDAETVERWRKGFVEAEVLREKIVFSLNQGLNGELDLTRIWNALG